MVVRLICGGPLVDRVVWVAFWVVFISRVGCGCRGFVCVNFELIFHGFSVWLWKSGFLVSKETHNNLIFLFYFWCCCWVEVDEVWLNLLTWLWVFNSGLRGGFLWVSLGSLICSGSRWVAMGLWNESLWWLWAYLRSGGFLGVASFFNLGEISSIYGGKSELVISENILLKIFWKQWPNKKNGLKTKKNLVLDSVSENSENTNFGYKNRIQWPNMLYMIGEPFFFFIKFKLTSI